MRKIVLFILGLSLVSNIFGQWDSQITGFANPSTGIRYIHALDEEIVWCTAYNGVNPSSQTTLFCKTLNGGISWATSEVTGYSGYGTSMIFGLDGNIAWIPVFAPTGGGAILKTIDGGSIWIEQTTAQFSGPSGFPNLVHFWNSNDGFCAGDPNGGYFEIYTTINGGQNWNRISQIDIPDPIANDEYGVTGYYSVIGDTVWVSTNKGRILKSVNRGNNWIAISTPIGETQFKVVFRNSLHGIIYDNQSNPVRIWETFDGGNSWTEIMASGPLFNIDICYVPGTNNTWISTGNDEGVSYSYDGGHNWELFQNLTGMNFLSARFVSPNVGWAGDFTIDAVTGGINKYTGNLQPLVNDVGVISIDLPPLFEPGEIIPSVTFKNFGSVQQSFDVSITISGIYTSIVPVINLDPFQSIQLDFDPWQANEGIYDISVVTLFSNDMNSNNDFLETQVEVRDLTLAYAYVAYDVSGNSPHGPCKLYLEAPELLISIDNQVASNFVSAGTWGPENKWFGAVYFDDTNSTGGEFISINTSTGERTIIGVMGQETIHGLAYDFANGIMYATTYDGVTSYLHTVDVSNGSLSLIGATNSEILINLACNSIGELYSVDMISDDFGVLNSTTGEFVPLFSCGFDVAFAQDLEFDRNNDTCYMAAFNDTTGAGELHIVDIDNDSLIFIGQFANGAEVTGFAIPYSPFGINEYIQRTTLNIYPNPGIETLTLKSKFIISRFQLRDSKGVMVLDITVDNYFYLLDIIPLPVGIYSIEVELDNNQKINKQFIKVE